MNLSAAKRKATQLILVVVLDDKAGYFIITSPKALGPRVGMSAVSSMLLVMRCGSRTFKGMSGVVVVMLFFSAPL